MLSVIGDYDGFANADVDAYAPAGQYSPSIGSTSGLAFAAAKPTFVVRAGNDNQGQSFPIYYSDNSGGGWTKFASKPSDGGAASSGQVAVSADGGAVLWSPDGLNNTYRTTNLGATWKAATGLSQQSAVPVSDPVNPQKFYAFNPSSGNVLVSTDGGAAFNQAGSAGNGGSKIMRAAPGREGDLWIAKGGLLRSTNSGGAFAAVGNVSGCTAVGFGAAAPGHTYPAVYIWGKAGGGPLGIYRSDDIGATWVRINDDAHQYGGPGNGEFVQGDANVYGRVYMSTAGRGIIYGDLGSKVAIRESARPGAAGPLIRVSGDHGGAFTSELTFTMTGIRETGPGGSRFSLMDLRGHLAASGPLKVSREGSATFAYRGARLVAGAYIVQLEMGSAISQSRVMLPR